MTRFIRCRKMLQYATLIYHLPIQQLKGLVKTNHFIKKIEYCISVNIM